jgi:hypothetical protein
MNIQTPCTIILLLLVLFTACDFNSEEAIRTNTQETSSERPNIIVMYSDDHTAQAVGAYQGVLNYGLQLDHTPTPNIDRLAENGMRFR